MLELARYLCDQSEQTYGYDLVPGWCWGYACRPIRGTSTPSNHSWGLALDLNAPKNPMASSDWHRRNANRNNSTFPFGLRIVTDMPEGMVLAWERAGFRWGGRYRNRPDCVTGDTPVITRDGPVRIDTVAGSEVELLTMDETWARTEWVKAPVHRFGLADTFSIVLSRGGKRTVIDTTGDHRWPVWNPDRKSYQFVVTSDLRPGDGLLTPDYPHEHLTLDERAIVAGLVWGDGSIYNTHGNRTPQGQLRLYGPKTALLGFAEPFGRYTASVAGHPGAVAVMGLPGDLGATLPSTHADLEVVAGFFAGWFATDGCVPADGYPPSLSTSDTEAVEWLKTVAPSIGITITNIGTQPAGKSGFGSTKDNHMITFRSVNPALLIRDDQRQPLRTARTSHRWKVESVTPAGRQPVFCPSVDGRFVWGVDTGSVPLITGNSMHFEFMGTPAQMAATTAKLTGGPPGMATQLDRMEDKIDKLLRATYDGYAANGVHSLVDAVNQILYDIRGVSLYTDNTIRHFIQDQDKRTRELTSEEHRALTDFIADLAAEGDNGPVSISAADAKLIATVVAPAVIKALQEKPLIPS